MNPMNDWNHWMFSSFDDCSMSRNQESFDNHLITWFWQKIVFYVLFLKPLSITHTSVGSRTAAAGNVGATVLLHVAKSGRSRTDAVICNWKGLKLVHTRIQEGVNFWKFCSSLNEASFNLKIHLGIRATWVLLFLCCLP